MQVSESDHAGEECANWKSLRGGDAKALALIFQEYYDELYRYGMKLIQEEELVKDCVQNLFLKLWVRRESLGAVKVVKPYLFKALRRHIGDEAVALRKKKNLQDQFFYEFDITFSYEDFLIATQESKEQSEYLAAALNRLSKRQKEAVFLKFYQDLDYEKIAEVMELNIQSVRNLIYQSLKSLKDQMIEPPSAVIIKMTATA
jgi:RNA polymerase sigma factor (sigma-70 family)